MTLLPPFRARPAVWSPSMSGTGTVPSRWRWRPSSGPASWTRCGPPIPAPAHWKWRPPTSRLAEAQAAWAARRLPQVELVEGSWLTPLPGGLRGHVDLVVSNPPYVTADEWAELAPEVRAEPRQALVAAPGRDGAAGLADVEAVLEQARQWLRRPGAVVVELAPHQAGAARERARQIGYDEVRVEPDLAGRDRALVARLCDAQ